MEVQSCNETVKLDESRQCCRAFDDDTPSDWFVESLAKLNILNLDLHCLFIYSVFHKYYTTAAVQ